MPKLRRMLGDIYSPECTALMRLIETQSKETLGKWALGYATENYLPIYEAAFPEDRRLREAAELCERLELDTSKKIGDLSFGNRKKVAIVCALQHNPRLCILDEPTGGLDPLMQREFFEILKERNARGATVFLSSHILSEIQRNCNRAAIIREGKIIACDSVEALSKTNAKRVHIQGCADLSELSEVRDIQKTENGTSFLYGGDINNLLRVLSKHDIEDLSVSEPDLEEIFMHYYSEGGEAK